MNEDIASLQAAIDSMRIELEEMRAERDEAYEQIDRYKNGYEGGCHACEIVAVRNQELLAERDEARREIYGDCDHTKNKIDDLHIDYRLRVATKRSDLPDEIVRLLSEAYAEIVHLNRQLDETRKQLGKYTLDEIARLDEELGLNGD